MEVLVVRHGKKYFVTNNLSLSRKVYVIEL